MTLLFLGFKNRLRPHGEGLTKCEHFLEKRGSGCQFFGILCWCLFGRPLIYISGSCVQWRNKWGKWGHVPQDTGL